MDDIQDQLKKVLFGGVRKGWTAFVWMCKIVIPISLAVTLLQSSGILDRLDFVTDPLMRLLNLPGEAALPIVSGMLVNVYAAIAVTAAIPFSTGQITLIAIFTLIAHSLILEGAIQHKCGMNMLQSIGFRIAVAAFTVFAVSHLIGGDTRMLPESQPSTTHVAIIQVLKNWAVDLGWLLAKILGIVTGIMVLQDLLKASGWMPKLIKVFHPVMRALGLAQPATLAWLTGVVFGLMYGSAVIVEESKTGKATGTDLNRLHLSLGINHSMIEDPLLFAASGASLFWLWIPRFVAAILAVHAVRLASALNRRWRPQKTSQQSRRY